MKLYRAGGGVLEGKLHYLHLLRGAGVLGGAGICESGDRRAAPGISNGHQGWKMLSRLEKAMRLCCGENPVKATERRGARERPDDVEPSVLGLAGTRLLGQPLRLGAFANSRVHSRRAGVQRRGLPDRYALRLVVFGRPPGGSRGGRKWRYPI